MTLGSSFDTTVLKVVDGDTIDVEVEGRKKRVRLACLDTEESNPGGDKPMTPWGKQAKEEAQRFFPLGGTVTVEFPGTEPLAECVQRYLDNYERLLAFVHKDGADYQEHMIRAGYSPYFVKYGNAAFAAHHDRTSRPRATPRQRMRASGTRSGSTARSSATTPRLGRGGSCAPG